MNVAIVLIHVILMLNVIIQMVATNVHVIMVIVEMEHTVMVTITFIDMLLFPNKIYQQNIFK